MASKKKSKTLPAGNVSAAVPPAASPAVAAPVTGKRDNAKEVASSAKQKPEETASKKRSKPVEVVDEDDDEDNDSSSSSSSNKAASPPPPPEVAAGDEAPKKKAKQSAAKKGTGRKAIPIKPIEDKPRRMITFSKRKRGLLNKASELAILTNSQVLVVAHSEHGHTYTYASPCFQSMITEGQPGFHMLAKCVKNLPRTPPAGSDTSRGGMIRLMVQEDDS
jgi:hypothetical protein